MSAKRSLLETPCLTFLHSIKEHFKDFRNPYLKGDLGLTKKAITVDTQGQTNHKQGQIQLTCYKNTGGFGQGSGCPIPKARFHVQGMQGFCDRVGRERESEAFLGFLQSEGLFFAEGGPQFLEKTGEMAGKRSERAGESRGGLVGKDDFEGASGKIERAKKFSDGNLIFMIEISR